MFSAKNAPVYTEFYFNRFYPFIFDNVSCLYARIRYDIKALKRDVITSKMEWCGILLIHITQVSGSSTTLIFILHRHLYTFRMQAVPLRCWHIFVQFIHMIFIKLSILCVGDSFINEVYQINEQ